VSPFLQFRVWLRQAPGAERAGAAAIAAVLLALISLALVPAGGSHTTAGVTGATGGNSSAVSAASAGPSSAGQAPASGRAGVSSVSFAGSQAATGSPAATGASSGAATNNVTAGSGGGNGPVAAIAGSSCGSLTSTDQGVTASEVHIDIDVADLEGQAGNNLVGIPSPQQEEAMFGAAVNAANANGGVRCRKLVAKYYTADALNPSSLEAVCLEIVADHPFALLDEGLSSPDGPSTPRDCPPSYKIPEFGTLHLSQAEIHQYAPYLFGDYSTAEEIVNDWVFAVHQLGWFNGYGKIGLLEQDCTPDINGIVLGDLAKVGIPSSKIKTFDFGCPDQIPPPNQVEEAVVEFKTSGVTNVMDDGGVYESYFSKDAAEQDYKPKYSVADQASIALWDNPDFGPDPSNFSGALAITDSQYGAENTPRAVFSSQTAACNKAMAAQGLPQAQHSPDGFAGVACTLVTMLVDAANNAPSLVRSDLATGLTRTGTADMPFPDGPANFAGASGLHGGGFWRPDVWVSSCACFQVQNFTYTPSFAPFS
jgi:hypothetical protein